MFNNEPIVSPDYQISCFADTHTLYIPETFDEDAGRFSVIAENDSGKATCSAVLEVVEESAAPPKLGSPAIAPTLHAKGYKPPPQQPIRPPMIEPEIIAPVVVAPAMAAPPPPRPVAPPPGKTSYYI